jgi:hypothetical protein
MCRCRLVMYSPSIPQEARDNLIFMEFVDSPEEAIELARRKFPKKAEVAIFPHGGMTYPIVG